ncbi:MAG: PIN domain-containing protein [Chloroflexota bacterium]
MLTVDASVWVAVRYSSEPANLECMQFFEQLDGTGLDLLSPTLLLVEVASAVARKSRNEAMGLRIAEEIASLVEQRWYPLDERLAVVAHSLAARLFLRGADAVYIAVASVTGSTLITLDRELITRAGEHVPIMTPAGWIASHPRI